MSLLRNSATPSRRHSALEGQNIIYSGSLLKNCAIPSRRSSALSGRGQNTIRVTTLVCIDEGAMGNKWE